jgi:hypothetical protein
MSRVSLSDMLVGEEVGRSCCSVFIITYERTTRHTGKTLCLGTRLAKLELRLITAMFVLGFRHRVVDKSGKIADHSPIPNWNDILFARPQNNSYNLKYERSGILL